MLFELAPEDRTSTTIMNGLREQDFTSFGGRLRPGSRVHDGSDSRNVPMRPAELSEPGDSAVDADPHTEIGIGVAGRISSKTIPTGGAAALNVASCQHGASRVVILPDREAEDRHHGVSDGLVQKAVIFPDRRGAFIVEAIEQGRDHLGS